MAKSKRLFGKAPLTVVRTRSGSAAYVYKGRPAPNDITDEERKRLLGEGYLEEREVEDAKSEADAGGKPTSVKAILAEVGDDKAKAQEFLAEEQAKPTDKQRASLISDLEAVIAAE